MSPKKEADVPYLDNLFARLPLPKNQSSTRGLPGYWKGQKASGCTLYFITSAEWWELFAGQYGHKYQGEFAVKAANDAARAGGYTKPAGTSRHYKTEAAQPAPLELQKKLLTPGLPTEEKMAAWAAAHIRWEAGAPRSGTVVIYLYRNNQGGQEIGRECVCGWSAWRSATQRDRKLQKALHVALQAHIKRSHPAAYTSTTIATSVSSRSTSGSTSQSSGSTDRSTSSAAPLQLPEQNSFIATRTRSRTSSDTGGSTTGSSNCIGLGLFSMELDAKMVKCEECGCDSYEMLCDMCIDITRWQADGEAPTGSAADWSDSDGQPYSPSGPVKSESDQPSEWSDGDVAMKDEPEGEEEEEEEKDDVIDLTTEEVSSAVPTLPQLHREPPPAEDIKSVKW